MQLDALMRNDISVISHFTFTQSAPELSFQLNIAIFIHKGTCNKNLIILLVAALCNTVIAMS